MRSEESDDILKNIIRLSRYTVYIALLAVLGITTAIFVFFWTPNKRDAPTHSLKVAVSEPLPVDKVMLSGKALPADYWTAPDENTIPAGNAGKEIRYGKELIAHTAIYLGPKGKIATISNGMNCQNCHNNAGTKLLGLNYSAVASTYPQFKARDNKMLSIADRINGCFQRSLNGKALDTTSAEMKAMIAYMKWLGKDVPKGKKPKYNAVEKLAYLDRPADPIRGEAVFAQTCKTCHGADGQGQLNVSGNEFIYPPLWGEHSYNDGAGLNRLRNFAGFVKNNMPFGISYEHPLLTDEQAWDVAAFVNSQKRPHKDQSADWHDIAKKPVDFPFGPYADDFPEEQHKYGPFRPIEEALENKYKINKL